MPFFAKEVGKFATFNARIETVDTSGMFREPFKKRRCLIPADGYFEWTTSLVDGKKDPWLLQLPEGKGFSFAGLCAYNDNLGLASCTIITAPAVEHIAHIHDRMPVILEEDAYYRHLDNEIVFHRVDRAVGNSRYEGTDTKKPIVNSL